MKAAGLQRRAGLVTVPILRVWARIKPPVAGSETASGHSGLGVGPNREMERQPRAVGGGEAEKESAEGLEGGAGVADRKAEKQGRSPGARWYPRRGGRGGSLLAMQRS